MNTATRRITVAVTAIVAAATFPSPAANAKPDRIGNGASGPPQVVTETEKRPCFMVRANWNESLDGPQPTCPDGWH